MFFVIHTSTYYYICLKFMQRFGGTVYKFDKSD